MFIKKLIAKAVKDSRGEKTIQVIVKTPKGKFRTSAPSGKSKGKFEVKSYLGSLEGDICFLNGLDVKKINKSGIKKFSGLKKLEKLIGSKIGANSLFALEASILKALACEEGKELYRFLGGRRVDIRPVGNAIGGGIHSKDVKGKHPDFQEFLFISNCEKFSDCVKVNERAYKMVRKFLKVNGRNDEGAWETPFSNEEVLEVMRKVADKLDIEIGLDVAGSSFFRKGRYVYKNSRRKLNRREQIDYLAELIDKYEIFYVEDGLNETDFRGFGELLGKIRDCLIVGDDLIATNPRRLKKTIKLGAVNAIIVKPNQIGSLLKVKEVVEICNRAGIKTIISHRSGETTDDTIADLAVGFGCDFIKTGIYGRVRKAKLKRLVRIEKARKV